MAATGLKEERAKPTPGQRLKENPLRQEVVSRRYDLDWIRILIILTLVPYHTALIYLEDESFYIKNGQLSMAFDGFVSFVGSWGMQVLFIVAGAANCFALRNTTASQFFRKKLLRLLLPLLFGVLVIVPPIAYFARLNKGSYTGTYWQFYPHFFEFDPADANGFNGHFGPAHLWFVLFLFVLSVIALPLFAWFKGDKGQRFCAWLA